MYTLVDQLLNGPQTELPTIYNFLTYIISIINDKKLAGLKVLLIVNQQKGPV